MPMAAKMLIIPCLPSYCAPVESLQEIISQALATCPPHAGWKLASGLYWFEPALSWGSTQTWIASGHVKKMRYIYLKVSCPTLILAWYAHRLHVWDHRSQKWPNLIECSELNLINSIFLLLAHTIIGLRCLLFRLVSYFFFSTLRPCQC